VVTDLSRRLGRIPVMDAETHDRLVAGVNHAAFVLSVGYVLSVRAVGLGRSVRLAARGFGHERWRRRPRSRDRAANRARADGAAGRDQRDAGKLRRHLEPMTRG
jgi:prephenate dehydrogenase